MSTLLEVTVIDFSDLKPVEIPVNNLFGKNYVLKEATGDVAVRYKNAGIRGARMADGKLVGLDSVADAEPVLVAGCLFEIMTEPNDVKRWPLGRPVAERTVKEWPGRVQKELFKTAKKISQLDDDETEESLEKVIAEAGEKLDKLKAERARGESKEGALKNGLKPTAGGSATGANSESPYTN